MVQGYDGASGFSIWGSSGDIGSNPFHRPASESRNDTCNLHPFQGFGGSGRVASPSPPAASSLPAASGSGRRKSSSTLENELGDAMDDAFLAKEMNELSVKERQTVLEELHGVAETIEDSPDFDVQEHFKAFDAALKKIPKSKRKAYDRAIFLRPSLETSEKYKFMFLRADGFDTSKAARRLVGHFELKAAIFGGSDQENDESLLAKDITWEDLGEETHQFSKVFGSSSIFLKKKDRGKRPVWYTNLSNVDWSSQFDSIIQSDHGGDYMLRFMYYFLWSMVWNDDDAQKLGICRVAYSPANTRAAVDDDARHTNTMEASERSSNSNQGTTSFFTKNFSKIASVLMKGKALMAAMPFRFSSYHFCHTDPGINAALNLIRLCFGKEVRVRMRTHTGSPLELQYSLQSFGIDCDGLFDGSSLASTLDQHQNIMTDYLQRRQALEQRRTDESQSSDAVLYPSKYDVLIGRGSPYQDYVGNRLFVHLVIEPQLETFMQQNDQFVKTCMSMDAVQTIQKRYGGRFLQKGKAAKNATRTSNGDGWAILGDVAARDKTAAMFRYKARTYKKAAASAPVKISEANTNNPESQSLLLEASSLLLLEEASDSIESTIVANGNGSTKHPRDSIMGFSNSNADDSVVAAKRLRV